MRRGGAVMNRDTGLFEFYQCSTCDLALQFKYNARMPACLFCGGELLPLKNCDNYNKEIDFCIPFKYTLKQFHDEIAKILIENDFCPDDIFEKIKFDTIGGVFLKFCCSEGSFSGQFTADIHLEKIIPGTPSRSERVSALDQPDVYREIPGSPDKIEYIFIKQKNHAMKKTNFRINFFNYSRFIEHKLRYIHPISGKLIKYNDRFLNGFAIELSHTDINSKISENIKICIEDRLKNMYNRGLTKISYIENIDISRIGLSYKMCNCIAPLWTANYYYDNKKYYIRIRGDKLSEHWGVLPVNLELKDHIYQIESSINNKYLFVKKTLTRTVVILTIVLLICIYICVKYSLITPFISITFIAIIAFIIVLIMVIGLSLFLKVIAKYLVSKVILGSRRKKRRQMLKKLLSKGDLFLTGFGPNR
jgi:hypothetical protein